MNDLVIGKGCLDITLTRADGSVEKCHVHNLVVTTGRNHIADQLAGQTESVMSHMGLGESSDTPVIADTELGSEIVGSRKAFTSKAQGAGSEANKIVYNTTWAAGEGTGAIREAGLFNAITDGVMLARTQFDVQNKGVGDSLSIQWTLTITG